MRQAALRAAALAVAAGGASAAMAGMTFEAAYLTPYEGGENPSGWPAFRSIELRVKRSAGDPEGLFSGALSRRMVLTSEEDGFFMGFRPQIADVDGDAYPDLATIQYLPQSGWRLVVYDLSKPSPVVLGEVAYRDGVDEAVLIGIADLGQDGSQDIGVAVRKDDAQGLFVYSFHHQKPVTRGPFSGYDAGPVADFPRIRDCGDGPAFLLASVKTATVTAFRSGNHPESLLPRGFSSPATTDGFAAARSCE